MASTILALNKYSFSDKTLLTTIFNGRMNSNYENTQAFLVKTLPIVSINDDRNISIRQMFNQIDEIWKNGIRHSNYPYIKIAEEFNLKPEFMYSYNNLELGNIKLNNNVYEIKRLNSLETNYKVTFNVYENKEDLELNILYNNSFYSEKYIISFLDSVLYIVNQFIDGNIEQLKINEIELDSRDELPTFSPVENPILHRRFEKYASEKANDVALVAIDTTLTYGELNEKSNRIANALIKKGVKPKSNVLVMLHRNSTLIASILGILKAGCAYIPIDLEYPRDRIEYIYENSQADYIISEEDDVNSLNVKDLLEEVNTTNPDIEISPDDLAYMIYTSGSTGKPKGVMISHKNITNLFVENEDNLMYNIYKGITKALSITTVSFDPFLLDLSSLTFGLQLVLASDSQTKNIEELTDLIRREMPDAITSSTPSRIKQYMEYEEFTKLLPNFKYIGTGGEMMPKELVSEVSSISDVAFYNTYGPTETTVASNALNVMESDKITVGKALFNYITDVRDLDGKLLPQGVMGELYIGGPGVSKGY